MILYEMFRHAAIEGQKEAEQAICQGNQQNMPQLNPEAGIPAVQLVGPGTTKQELLEIYLEVYKLHRLLGSPPGEPAILEDVLSSLPDQQRCEEVKAPAATAQQCDVNPIHPGAIPPTEQGKMTQWQGV